MVASSAGAGSAAGRGRLALDAIHVIISSKARNTLGGGIVGESGISDIT